MNLPVTKNLIWWCVPGLLVAALVRLKLLHDAPLACFNEDLEDFLKTALSLHQEGGFELHEKKTIFLPLFYSALAAMHLPILGVVPIVQHLLGFAQVGLYGLIVAPLVRFWKVFVPLLTILFALNPSFLFFEHFLWAEAFYLFFVVALAAAGIRYVMARSRLSAVLMGLAFFLTALTRPEGRFFALFPVLLVGLNEWRHPRRLAEHLLPTLVACAVVMLSSHGDEGGRLLYGSVLHLTPEHPRAAPGIETHIASLKAEAIQDWDKYDRNGLLIPPTRQMKISKSIAEITGDYLQIQDLPSSERFRLENKLCFRLGIETCFSQPIGVLGVMIKKAAANINNLPGLKLDTKVVQGKECRLFAKFQRFPEPIFPLLAGRENFPDEAAAIAFAKSRYPRNVHWFNRLYSGWQKGLRKFSWPRKRWHFDGVLWPAWPQIYTVSFIGSCIAISRKGAFQTWHLSICITLGLMAAMIFLTGNVRPRFRLFLEPFWLLYLGVIFDALAAMVISLRRQPAANSPN